MARAFLTISVIVLINVLVGCGGIDTGRSQLVPTVSQKTLKTAGISETDIIEEMARHRRAYRQALEQLVSHFEQTGNNMKLSWARKELSGLKKVRQYNYIIEASLAGPDLKATTAIAEAQLLYNEAVRTEQKAKEMVVMVNDNLLRIALEKYNELIRKHPSSDKIADAAFRCGGIYEHFKDYSLAVLYYKRVYQWDPDTALPARYRAAFILDKKLHQRDEALELYQQAVKSTKQGQNQTWREYAEKRIAQLTGAGTKSK